MNTAFLPTAPDMASIVPRATPSSDPASRTGADAMRGGGRRHREWFRMNQALEIPFALPAQPTPAIAQACEHCGGDFIPRTGSGGKPQRFCSPDCRTAFHERQRSQHGPTCERETQSKATAV